MVSLGRFGFGALVVIASGVLAGPATVAGGPSRIFAPSGGPFSVVVSSTDASLGQDFVHNFVAINILPEVRRTAGVGHAGMLGRRGVETRIRLDPDRMRAYNLTPLDIRQALQGCSLIGTADEPGARLVGPDGFELAHVGRLARPDQYEEIILRATPEGEILRLRDVGRAGPGPSVADIAADVDGRPAAALVLGPVPGSDPAAMVRAVRARLEHLREELFPPGMEFRVVAPDDRDAIVAVVPGAPGGTLEATTARCRRLGAIARGVAGVASVASLAGYQARTEGRDPGAGTCLLRRDDRPGRRPTAREVIAQLDARCRAEGLDAEFFEPPAAAVFVAPGGFAVRILDAASPPDDGRPEAFLGGLEADPGAGPVLRFLADRSPQSELVIHRDVARAHGVPIAAALAGRFRIVGDPTQAGPQARRLVEDFARVSFKTDRGELIPYGSFLRLVRRPGADAVDR